MIVVNNFVFVPNKAVLLIAVKLKPTPLTVSEIAVDEKGFIVDWDTCVPPIPVNEINNLLSAIVH